MLMSFYVIKFYIFHISVNYTRIIRLLYIVNPYKYSTILALHRYMFSYWDIYLAFLISLLVLIYTFI